MLWYKFSSQSCLLKHEKTLFSFVVVVLVFVCLFVLYVFLTLLAF